MPVWLFIAGTLILSIYISINTPKYSATLTIIKKDKQHELEYDYLLLKDKVDLEKFCSVVLEKHLKEYAEKKERTCAELQSKYDLDVTG